MMVVSGDYHDSVVAGWLLFIMVIIVLIIIIFVFIITINRLELLKFRNQLCATRDRVETYRMKLVDSPLDSPAFPLQLSVSAAS